MKSILIRQNICVLYLLLIISFVKLAHSTDNDPDQEKIKVKNWIIVDKGWPLQDNYDRYIREKSWPFYFTKQDIPSEFKWNIHKNIIDEFKNKTDKVFKLSFKYWEYGSSDFWPQPKVIADWYGSSDELTNLHIMYQNKYRKDADNGLQYWMPVEYIISYNQLTKFAIDFRTVYNNNLMAFKEIKLEYLEESDKFQEDNDINYGYIDVKIDSKDYDTVYVLDKTHKDTYTKESDYIYKLNYNYYGNARDLEIIFEYRLENDPKEIRNKFYSFRLENKILTDITINLNEFLAFTGANFYIYAKIKYFKNDQPKPEPSIVTITKSTEITKKTTKYPKYLLPMKDGVEWNKLEDGERSVWKEIPQEKYFTINYVNNDVKFKGLINNEQITTTSLVSQWINWNKTLLSVPLKYEISVDNREDFDGFRVRPQLCDWLFRCRDGTIVSTDTDDKKRIFSVTFAPIDDITKFVKLHFQVDYFRPSYFVRDNIAEASYTSKFNLKLIHFGDPCFAELQSSKCVGHYEECQSIDYSSNNYPNDPQCHCLSDYYPEKECNKINYCEHLYKDSKITTLISGNKYCNTLVTNKKIKCRPIPNDFECFCGTNNKLPDNDLINWNAIEHKCEQIEISGNWEKTTDPKIFIAPEKQANKLTVNFIPVLSDLDVCLEITTTIPNKVGINLDIQYEENNSILPSLFLSKTTSPQMFQLCLKDYIPNLPDKFSVNFLAPNNLDKNDLKLQIKAILQIKKAPTQYITNWKAMTIQETKDQLWTQFPNNKFGQFDPEDPITSRYKMSYKFTVNEKLIKTSHYLITPWINYNENFKTTPKYTFTIDFEDNNDKFGQAINIYLLYQNGNKITREVLWQDTTHGTDIIGKYKPEFSLNNIKENDFKIIIEFQFNNQYDFKKKAQYPITVSDINIGDSCFDDIGQPVCDNNACNRVKPNKFQCVCPQGLKGIHCEETDKCTLKSKIDGLTNNEYCTFFANADCQHLSDDKFMCNCPQPYYQWNQDQLICEQKTFVKTNSKTCDKGECGIFDSINTVMRSTNELMPTINSANYKKLLPFYLGFQNEGTIEIPVPKQKSSDPKINIDTCLKLQYKLSTTKSKLMVAYNDNKPIELNTIEYKPDGELINWQNEIVCANQISKNVDEKSPIQTFILNPSIYSKDSDMVAVKIEQKFVDRSDGVPYEKLSPIPFLTAFSDNDKEKDINFTSSHQWVTQFPYKIQKPYWSFIPDKISVITFSPQINTNNENYVSTLYSNWIEPGQSRQFTLNFVITSEYKDFAIEFLLFDETMNEITQLNKLIIGDPLILPNVDISYKKDSQIAKSFDKQEKIFRLGLRVTYKIQSAKQLIKIESVNCGDPCFDSENNHFCHGNGRCKSLKPYTPETRSCECKDGFTKQSHCKIQDFCQSSVELPNANTGYEYCKIHYLGNCVSNTYNSYKCDCNNTNTQYYDNRKLTCVSLPKCLSTSCSDPLTQQCVESDKDEPKCKCIFNERVQYVDENEGNGDLKCVPFDYCNQKHQLLLPKENRNSDPCGTGINNTICLSFKMTYENSKWVPHYKCACKPGFKTNIEGNNKISCTSHRCDISSSNKCEQKCNNVHNIVDGYTCECDSKYTKDGEYNCLKKSSETCDCIKPGWCGSDGKCQCKNGFKVDDNTGKTCIPSTISVDKSVCLNGKTKLLNNEIVCDCPSKGYTLEDGMCKPIDVCANGQPGQQDCANKNATCISNAKQPDLYECRCLPGKYRSLKLTFETNQTYCMDYCLYDRRHEKCEAINADCNPVIEPKAKEELKDFCRCKPGFRITDNSNKCDLAIKSLKLTINLQNLNTMLQPDTFLINDKIVHDDGYTDLFEYYDLLHKQSLRNMDIERQKSFDYYRAVELNDILTFIKLSIGSTTFSPDNYIKPDSIQLAIQSCNYDKTSKSNKCTIVVALDKSARANDLTTLSDEFKNLCYNDGSGKCFFPVHMKPLPPPKPKPSSTLKQLKSDNDDDIPSNYFTKQDITFVIESNSMTTPEVFKRCKDEESASMCGTYANCVEGTNTSLSLFSCLCNTKFFNINGSVIIETDEPEYRVIRQICSMRPTKSICNDVCKSYGANSVCQENLVAPIHEVNSWTVHTQNLCQCAQSFKLSATNATCIGACEGVNCNDGKCVTTGQNGYACLCDSKYTGQHCDEKLGEGGWIAGIVVLAVLVVIVSGAAIFFCRRSRGKGVQSTTSFAVRN